MLVFLTLPHMKTAFFNQIPILDAIFNLWRIVSFAIILARLLLVRKRISTITLLLIIHQVYLFLVTAVNGMEVYGCAVSAFSVLSVVLLYDRMTYNREVFLSSQLFCFELAIYINLVSELLYPEGMYLTSGNLFVNGRNWFLGYYNNHTQYYIPALLFAWLYYKTTGKRIRTYLLTATIIASALLVWSGGVLVSLICMALAYIIFKNKTMLFNYYTYWSIHLFFFFFIVILKLQNLFQWLIDDVLRKWASLLARIDLWDRAWELIMKAPLFGHGLVDSTSRELENGFNWAMHAHNLLLEILYEGGIINLIIWVTIVVVGGKRIYRYRNTMESKIIAIAFLGWCIATLVEPFSTPFLMGMFVIAYCSNKECSAILTVQWNRTK